MSDESLCEKKREREKVSRKKGSSSKEGKEWEQKQERRRESVCEKRVMQRNECIKLMALFLPFTIDRSCGGVSKSH
jgi:hypothetical protein